MMAKIVLCGEFMNVSERLWLRRKAAAAVARRERERVQVRWDVAGGTRVGVVSPDPAKVIGLVDDEEVGDTHALQCHGHADPAEPRADHNDAVGRMLWHRQPPASRARCPSELTPRKSVRTGKQGIADLGPESCL